MPAVVKPEEAVAAIKLLSVFCVLFALSLSAQDKKKKLNNYAKYSNLGLTMAAIIVVGVFGGLKLDQWLELKFPVFTVVLSLLSVFGAIYYAIFG